MTKIDLVQAIARKLNVNVIHAEKYFNATIETITNTLADGEQVSIRGFGRFHVHNTKGKPQARNPRTGELHPVGPRRSPKFKAGKILKDKCNG